MASSSPRFNKSILAHRHDFLDASLVVVRFHLCSYIDGALQFVAYMIITQILHSHNLDHQTRPSREMLSALTSARVRVILLPGKASLLPALVDRLHEVLTQIRVELTSLVYVRTVLRSDIL